MRRMARGSRTAPRSSTRCTRRWRPPRPRQARPARPRGHRDDDDPRRRAIEPAGVSPLLPAARHTGVRRADCARRTHATGPGGAARLDQRAGVQGGPRLCAARAGPARGPARDLPRVGAGPGAGRDAGRDRVRGALVSHGARFIRAVRPLRGTAVDARVVLRDRCRRHRHHRPQCAETCADDAGPRSSALDALRRERGGDGLDRVRDHLGLPAVRARADAAPRTADNAGDPRSRASAGRSGDRCRSRRPGVGGNTLEDSRVFRRRQPLRVRKRARDRAVPVRGSSPPVPLAHRAAVHRCRGRFNDHTGARGDHGGVHRLPRGGTPRRDPRRGWGLPARVSHHRAPGSPFPSSGQEPTGESVRRWRHGRSRGGHRRGRRDPPAAGAHGRADDPHRARDRGAPAGPQEDPGTGGDSCRGNCRARAEGHVVRTRVGIALAGISILSRMGAAQQDDSAGRGASSATIRATLIRAPVTLDARLDEPFWATADSIDDFRQREPLEGSPATERTIVKVAHDADALYILVRCYDSNMHSVRASQLRRDADLSSDDNVRLLIDSFDDRRSAFVFGTNPNGTMWDAQFSGVDDLNENWNGIWEVAVSRDGAGWTAEFRIPLLALRFHAGTSPEFGFNVRRFLRRKNEEDLWRSYGRVQGFYHLNNEGTITDLGDLHRPHDLELYPYALGRAVETEHDSVGGETTGGYFGGKGGVDAQTGGTDEANDAVVRVQHDLFNRSYIGAIGTLHAGSGSQGAQRAGGLDVDLPLVVHGANLEPKFWIAGSQTPGVPGTALAWRLPTDNPNDLFDNFVSLYRIDSGFAPPLGFVRRTGIWETTGHVDFMPRPGVLGIRQLDFTFPIPSWDIIANETGSPLPRAD